MLIDVHMHVWEQQHHSDKWGHGVERTVGIGKNEYYHVEPSRFLSEVKEASLDKAVIHAFVMKVKGSRVPDDYVFENYTKKYPDKLIGFSGIDPITDEGRFNRKTIEQLEKAVKDYGFKGMKLMPPFGHYYPNENKIYPLYEKAAELDIPVMFHQGSSRHTEALLKYARPYLLEDVAYDFPELKIIIAHTGYPWSHEVFALMRKQPHVYTDISALFKRPTILSQNLMLAKEYGVTDRVLFGTDYPVDRPVKGIEWCRTDLNRMADKLGYPTWSKEEIDGLLGENSRRLLGLK